MKQLAGWFGVKGTASQLAAPLLQAIGVDADSAYQGVALGTPDLLVSRRRAAIIESRERLLGE